MNYYKRHIGDYAAATRHLSLLEHGVYTIMLDIYYTSESPLPSDIKAVQRLVCARSEEERQAVKALLDEFFEAGADGWRQSRCDEEIEASHAKAEISRSVGRLGGRPKKAKASGERDVAIAYIRPLNTDYPITQQVSEKNPAGFDVFAQEVIEQGLSDNDVGLSDSEADQHCGAEGAVLDSRQKNVEIAYKTPLNDPEKNPAGFEKKPSGFPETETLGSKKNPSHKPLANSHKPIATNHSSLRSEVKSLSTLRVLVDEAKNPTSVDPAESDGGDHKPTGKGLPACPVQAVVDLYHEVLPELPRVERMNDTRRTHIRQRWREWAAEKGWQTSADGLAEWRGFFEWCRQSDFLMGKTPPTPPRKKSFAADVDFLFNSSSHLKIFEGRYHA